MNAKPLAAPLLLTALFGAAALVACNRPKPTPPGTQSAASASAELSTSEGGGPDEVKPVYPPLNGPPDPMAVKLCDVLHDLQARRKAECCGGAPSLASMTKPCVDTLSVALASKAVTIDPAALDRCVEASSRSLAGCDWVTPLSAPTSPECRSLLRGALDAGARCRSSVECAAGLHCQGAGATAAGVCGKPRDAGACNLSVDVLASYARQDDAERTHPECGGYCKQRRCQPPLAEGAECRQNPVCGPNSRCVQGHCARKPAAGPGATCLDWSDCTGDLRCVEGKCTAPSAGGTTCSSDNECRGACNKPKGSPTGTCGMACSGPFAH